MSEDPELAIKDAFDEIKMLSKLSHYHEGFNQFADFIAVVCRLFHEKAKDDPWLLKQVIYRLIYSLASNEFKGDDATKKRLKSLISLYPEWEDEFERTGKFAKDFIGPESELKIQLLKDNKSIGSFPVSEIQFWFKNICPGYYAIQLSTGRKVWQGKLTHKDLLWGYAFPEKDLPLAAETEQDRREHTIFKSFFDGTLEMLVFPGLECGEITIRVKR